MKSSKSLVDENSFNGIEPIEVKFNCDICKDQLFVKSTVEDYVIVDHDLVTLEPIYLKECKCKINNDFKLLMKRSNLGSIYEEIKNEEYRTKYDWQKEYKKKAHDFVLNDDTGFIMSGQTGSGKSLLLGKMLANLVSRGKKCYYLQWVSDRNKFINRFNNQDDTQINFVHMLQNIEVLYIDDLFKTRNNDIETLYKKDMEINIFWDIINTRIADPKKKTIISTELFMDDFDQLDSSLRGRLLQLTKKGHWIQMDKSENRDIRVQIYNDEF